MNDEIVEVKQQGPYDNEKRAYPTFWPEEPVLARVVQFLECTYFDGDRDSHQRAAIVCFLDTGEYREFALDWIRARRRA